MDDIHPMTWVAFAFSVAATMGTLVKAMIDSVDKNKLAKIIADKEVALAADKTHNDAEKTDLRMKVAILAQRADHCEEGHQAVSTKLNECEDRHRETSSRQEEIVNRLQQVEAKVLPAT